MDSSSDGGFAWTDASDTSDDTSDNETMVKSSVNTSQSGEESESGKSYKKKLQQRLFSGSNDDKGSDIEPCYEKKRKRSLQHSDAENIKSSKKKRIKAEPESDIEQRKEKINPQYSKNAGHTSTNDSYDESYLSLRVKNEQNFVSLSPVKTKKSKPNNNSIASDNCIKNGDGDENNLSKSSENPRDFNNSEDVFNQSDEKSNYIETNDNEINKIKKKKKSKRIRSDSEGENSVKESIIEDSFCAEETIVQQHTESYRSKNSHDELANGSSSLSDDQNKKCRTNKKIAKKIQNHDVSENKKTPINSLSGSDNTKRKSRISEKLIFEDDCESDVQTKNNKTPTITTKKNNKLKLKRFVETKINLKPFLRQLQSPVLLTSEDELWVIKCPKDIKVEAFQDKKICFENKCKIKLDGHTYEGSVDVMRRNMTIFSAAHENDVIKNFLVNGSVRLRRRIPKAHIQEDNIMVNNQNNFIPLPETKCRHPLFGFNYKKALKLPATVVERLKAPQSYTSIVTEKRKKKKAKQKEDDKDVVFPTPKIEPESEICSIPEELRNTTAYLKKKKRKRKNSDMAVESEHPQHKRVRHNPESADAWESERAIEENLFNF